MNLKLTAVVGCVLAEGIKNYSWKNWSESQKANFRDFLKPESVEDLQALVERSAKAGDHLKFVGSSHSFSPIIADDGARLVSLERWAGIESIDKERMVVRVRAGTKIKQLSVALWEAGFALTNLGDIDEQSLAGAISTGTHGTGLGFQNLAGFVESIDLISPERGRECFVRGSGEFAALAVGSFAFGVVSHYELKIVPRYHLRLRMFPSTISSFAKNFEDWVYTTRNAEVFWFPGTESTLVKLTDEAVDARVDNKKGEWVSTYVENFAFGMVNQLNNWLPRTHGSLRFLLKRLLPNMVKVDRSYKVYATERHVKFQETEYSLPLSSLWPVVEKMRAVLMSGKYPTLFPVEFRFVKKDSLLLSPSFGNEDRVYIAVHTFWKDSFYRDYFRELESIFISYGGRPHWGKMFFAEREQFEKMYPGLDKVRKLRDEFDPQKLLLTRALTDKVF